jgi:hypothetical protein
MLLLLRVGELALQLWDLSILNLGGGVEVALTLGFLSFEFCLFELRIDYTDCINGSLFILPLGL